MPRSEPSLEQTLRADRLEEWKAVEVVRARELSGEKISGAIQRALSRGEVPPPPVSLDGLRRALDVLDVALAQAKAA